MYLALGAYGLAILIPFLLYVVGRVIVEIYLLLYGAGVICSCLEGPAGPLFHAVGACRRQRARRNGALFNYQLDRHCFKTINAPLRVTFAQRGPAGGEVTKKRPCARYLLPAPVQQSKMPRGQRENHMSARQQKGAVASMRPRPISCFTESIQALRNATSFDVNAVSDYGA